MKARRLPRARRRARVRYEVIRNVQQLVDAICWAGTTLRSERLWFRGHACAGWTVVPKVYRCKRYTRDREVSMTLEFRLRAMARHGRCPEYNDIAEWLSLMQHHGLPTRLLDWTESPLTAAFFAVAFKKDDGADKDEGKDAAVWALNPGLLNKIAGWREEVRTFRVELIAPQRATGKRREVDWEKRFRRAVIGAFDDKTESDGVFAVAPPEIDPRMMVQQSMFTIHGTETPLEESEGADKFLMKFVVPAETKPALASDLRRLGLRKASLFPDLDNLASELAET